MLRRAGEIARERLGRYSTSIADDEYRLKSECVSLHRAAAAARLPYPRLLHP